MPERQAVTEERKTERGKKTDAPAHRDQPMKQSPQQAITAKATPPARDQPHGYQVLTHEPPTRLSMHSETYTTSPYGDQPVIASFPA